MISAFVSVITDHYLEPDVDLFFRHSHRGSIVKTMPPQRTRVLAYIVSRHPTQAKASFADSGRFRI